MKKLLSFLISVTIMLSVFPQIIFAENDVNLLADADFENVDAITDGGWKPKIGEWGSGLGTSVTVDTEQVSPNNSSTKSAKIINAALFQSVELEQDKNYSLSFDIYLNSSFDNSKLQWGIFNLNGVWIGSALAGYNSGTTVTPSNFDISKKEEWQTVNITFDCPSSSNYVVQFFYSGNDGISIDNVSLIYNGETEPSIPTSTPTTTDTPDISLINPDFENGVLSSTNSWKFTGAEGWYGYGNTVLDTNTVYGGTHSAKVNNGAIGQRVTLEAGKKYKLSAYVYPTEFYVGGVNLGFYDGSSAWPMSSASKIIEIPVDWTDSWAQCSVIMECSSTHEYIVGAFVPSSDIYFDNFELTETDEDEPIISDGISVDYNAETEITYNSDKLLNVSRGGYLINNNNNYMPSLYDKMAEDGVNMVRMDWILADIFYEIVSRGDDGTLEYNFTYLDNTILPLLEKGMRPYMCMSKLPQALGSSDRFGEARSGVANLTEYGEVINKIVRHYADMGYTGWYWESHNEPEDGHMGNVNKVCEEYGAFAKAVKSADPTAKVGGIGYRNGDVSKDASWKTTFFSYLQNNKDIPIDFVSIHVYSGVTDFSNSENYQSLMANYGLTDIPIIYSEWNYDWTVGTPGSFKDTNCNAAYGAKRLFTLTAQDNVDYAFYFTPSDALNPGELMNGDSGLYTIDGHRKPMANMFAMYNDMENECLQSERELKLNKNSTTYGLVTKNSDTKRITALLFNYSNTADDLDLEIKNLPYDKNVKITTKIIDENSGNYYKDYASGLRGYSETPHERPDTYTEIRSDLTNYKETINMTPYSVTEIIFEDTEEDAHSKTIAEKEKPQINLATQKNITASSEDTDGGTNDKGQNLLWSADKLTDGYKLTFDIVDLGNTNMGYRSQKFDTADNSVQIQTDLGECKKINEIKLYPLNDKINGGSGMPADFSIDVSTDGKDWTTVYFENSFDNKGSYNAKNIVFPTVDAKYVRLNTTKLSKVSDGYRLQLAEIEVYNDDEIQINDIGISENIQCFTDGKNINISEDVVMYQAEYENNTLKSVKSNTGRCFNIQDIPDGTVIYIWTNTMQPVTEPIQINN